MTSEAATLNKIESNWKLYVSLGEKIKDQDTRAAVAALCDSLFDRLATCPGSTRKDYIGSFPGGLVWYSLEVLKIMKELNKLYDANIPTDDLIIAGLFHNIGKIGSENEAYYLKTDDWHEKRGMYYEINPRLSSGQLTTRSLWWLNRFKVQLSEDAMNAIASLQHINQMHSSELYNAPVLTMILQQAVRAVCVMNNQDKVTSILET